MTNITNTLVTATTPDGYSVTWNNSLQKWVPTSPAAIVQAGGGQGGGPNFGNLTVQTTGIMQAGTFAVDNGTSQPTVTSGAGVPTSTPPNGSLYMRTDGTTVTGLYIYEGGAWAALGTGGGGGGVVVQNQGTGIGTYTTLNFTGSGVTASNAGGGVSSVTVSGGGGGTTVYSGTGAPVTLHNNGDIYFDISQTPAQGYVQEVVPVTPTFDGQLSGIFSATSSFTSSTFTCSSNCKLLVAMIFIEQATDQSVSTVTSTGLTFTRHNFIDNGGANSRFVRIEVWAAPVTTALSQTISLTLSGVTDDASCYFFGLANINTSTPFDTTADVTGFNATGISTLSLVTSTSNAVDLLFYAIGSDQSGPPGWANAPGFTRLANVYNGGASLYSELQICYQALSSTVSGYSINTGLTTVIPACAIAFAIKGPAAGAPQWLAFGGTPPLVTTVAGLPGTPYTGQRVVVTNSNTATFNAIVAGGGSSTVTVWWNGTNWVVG